MRTDPFTRFEEWLEVGEQTLGDRTVLLSLDEFEALDTPRRPHWMSDSWSAAQLWPGLPPPDHRASGFLKRNYAVTA